MARDHLPRWYPQPWVGPWTPKTLAKVCIWRSSALLGLFCAFLKRSWGFLGASCALLASFFVLSWAPLGPKRAPLQPQHVFARVPWALLGSLGAILGASWALLGDLYAPLGALLWPSGALLGHPDAILGRSYEFSGPSWCFLSAPWAPLGTSCPSPGALLNLLGAYCHLLGAFLCSLGAPWGLPEGFSSQKIIMFNCDSHMNLAIHVSHLCMSLVSCHTSLIQLLPSIQASTPPRTDSRGRRQRRSLKIYVP